jgi:hypothetical protein
MLSKVKTTARSVVQIRDMTGVVGGTYSQRGLWVVRERLRCVDAKDRLGHRRAITGHASYVSFCTPLESSYLLSIRYTRRIVSHMSEIVFLGLSRIKLGRLYEMA